MFKEKMKMAAEKTRAELTAKYGNRAFEIAGILVMCKVLVQEIGEFSKETAEKAADVTSQMFAELSKGMSGMEMTQTFLCAIDLENEGRAYAEEVAKEMEALANAGKEDQKKMDEYFITYSIGSNLGRCYSKIEAGTYEEARKIAHEQTQDRFAFIYSADDFKGQVEKYSLTLVTLQPQIYSNSSPAQL